MKLGLVVVSLLICVLGNLRAAFSLFTVITVPERFSCTGTSKALLTVDGL